MFPTDVDAIVGVYRPGGATEDTGDLHVRLVPFDDIKIDNFHLNIGRYVKAAAVTTTDLPTALAGYQAARAARLTAEQRMFAVLAAAGIEVDDG